MRALVAILVMVASASAQAGPRFLEIDLTQERLEFEQKDRSRKIGFALVAGTAVAGVASIYGYGSAASSRSQLEAQLVPVNLDERRALVQQGRQANTLGLVGALVGIGLAAGSAYFLSLSF